MSITGDRYEGTFEGHKIELEFGVQRDVLGQTGCDDSIEVPK